MSVLSAYLTYHCWRVLKENWKVQCGFKASPEHETFIQVDGLYVWQLYLAKNLELLDTIFFVLRKKYNQISFLHVFHHSVVLLVYWWVLYTREI
ncbi:elongation of very long chain fatty acids protein, partial [Nephila pilipes]